MYVLLHEFINNTILYAVYSTASCHVCCYSVFVLQNWHFPFCRDSRRTVNVSLHSLSFSRDENRTVLGNASQFLFTPIRATHLTCRILLQIDHIPQRWQIQVDLVHHVPSTLHHYYCVVPFPGKNENI